MKILMTENQFIRLILTEEGAINRDGVTLYDIWNGYTTFKHGDMQSNVDSPLIQIQNRLIELLPSTELGKKWLLSLKKENKSFKSDNDFGDKTAIAVSIIVNGKIPNNPKTIQIGPNTLSKIGFEKPEMLTLDEKIVAITLVMEKSSPDEDEIKAIANVIRNRNKAGRGSIIDIVLKCKTQYCQFSGWNDYNSLDKKDKEVIDRIMKEKRYMNKPSWDIAVKYAKLLLNNGNFGDNTDGATHYFNDYGKEENKPYWAKTINKKTNKLCWVPHELNKDFEHTFGRDTCTTWAKKPIE